MLDNVLKIDQCEFPITKATFQYDGRKDKPAWWFDIRTKQLADLPPGSALYGSEPRLYAEGDPIPLENSKDLTGTEFSLEEPYDPVSGDVYFTLYIHEH